MKLVGDQLPVKKFKIGQRVRSTYYQYMGGGFMEGTVMGYKFSNCVMEWTVQICIYPAVFHHFLENEWEIRP